MSKIKTTDDGWECVPELKHACRIIDSISDMTYEIKKCKRNSGLESLVNNMTAALEHAVKILDKIDTSDQYITVEYDWDELIRIDEENEELENDVEDILNGPLS